jgi:hypothetical protein
VAARGAGGRGGARCEPLRRAGTSPPAPPPARPPCPQVIADFANGEISQAASLFDTGITLEQYLDKSFYKTASLVAASCRSSAVFSGMTPEVKEAMYAYGKHLGLAFQVRSGGGGGGGGGQGRGGPRRRVAALLPLLRKRQRGIS